MNTRVCEATPAEKWMAPGLCKLCSPAEDRSLASHQWTASTQFCHPPSSMFVQLYNTLSVHSLIKPPKFESCAEESAQGEPVLTLADLKRLAFQERGGEQTKPQLMMQKPGSYKPCHRTMGAALYVSCAINARAKPVGGSGSVRFIGLAKPTRRVCTGL
ncbi:hypothetical protein HPB48_027129 [Haemaphysalis longicornis]|uniref:Uncharacterized protein n=1 Tax=Haemaphysalis longicornis TaxID=44386 RepID=A0A9J6HD66_HAELO|nr:hypothetical protein HPB48_027129 [Haemaphysalis longicornis]